MAILTLIFCGITLSLCIAWIVTGKLIMRALDCLGWFEEDKK